jgi:hypothetical protein
LFVAARPSAQIRHMLPITTDETLEAPIDLPMRDRHYDAEPAEPDAITLYGVTHEPAKHPH